jgi:metallophosphoesterase superfamily enzyme
MHLPHDMLLLNDIHVGFSRSGGTTPNSREALRTWLMDSLWETVKSSKEDALTIVGDLFDDFEISTRDLLDTYTLLSWWADSDRRLNLIAGNHDNSPKAARVSSFTALASILSNAYPDNVFVLDVGRGGRLSPDVYAIAHCANQDLFELALREAYQRFTDEPFKFLLLHANYDNGFAEESDHSLNVSEAAARSFTDEGVTVVFAHEHQARTELGGKVFVLGNQWPTSISDCLNNDEKFAHVITNGQIIKQRTWARDQTVGGFKDLDWRDLSESDADFVRVVGHASAAEASEVIDKIARFRQRSHAFVITNSVRVEGVAAREDLPQQFEAVKGFDAKSFIRQHLDDREMAVVEKLLG